MGLLSYPSNTPCAFCHEQPPAEKISYSIYEKEVPICKTCKTDSNRIIGQLFLAIFSPLLLFVGMFVILDLLANFLVLSHSLRTTFLFVSIAVGLILLVRVSLYTRKWNKMREKHFKEWLKTYTDEQI